MNHDSTVSEFDALVAALQQRLDSGDSAAFVDFLSRHPHLAAELHGYLAARQRADIDDELQQLFFFGRDDEDDHNSFLPPTRQYISQDRDPPPEVIALGRIGEYELLEKVATGGMGIVYKARQISLNRLVAIKTIRSGRLTTPTEIQRFRREAQAAAVLQHPNIVPVYEYGVIEGQHYFTMEFVNGPSLADLLREGPLEAKTAAAYVRTIACTVDYAHSRGIIHRDLKPSNVLLAEGGYPRITDFGVAKTVGHEGTLSGYGQIVGTPSYMSPEQSLGTNAASPLADIYSLGAILYALLTARPPFLAATEVDTLIQVRTQDPVAPRSLNRDIPPDIELICLKCLRKDPSQRYATAAELADDIDRYLTGLPIVARPISRAEACRRNPAVAVMASASILIGLLFVIALTNANLRLNSVNDQLNESIRELNKMRNKTESALEESVRSEAKAAQLLYASEMKEAGHAFRDGDERRMVEVLERQRPLPGKHDYRGGEWDFLWAHARSTHETCLDTNDAVYVVCYSPDERSIAAAGKDATIRIVDASTRRLVLEFATGQIEVNGLTFSADGMTLASAGDDGTVRLWAIDWAKRRALEKRTIKAHEKQVFDVALALNGKCLISSGREPIIRLWNPETGASLGTLQGHESAIAGISLSADGRVLASASHDGGIVIWDIAAQKPVKTIKSDSGRLTSISLSQDGQNVVSSSMGRKVQVWSVQSGKEVRSFDHLDQVERSLFTPDGSAVIACDHGGMIRIWKMSTESNLITFTAGISDSSDWKAHRDRIYSLAISSDSRRLLSAGADGKVFAWNLNREPQHVQLQKPSADFVEMSFIPGKHILATITTHDIEFWHAETGILLKQLSHSDDSLRCLTVSAGGTTLATGSHTGRLDLWDVFAGIQTATLDTRKNFQVDQIALSPDGSIIAAVERYESDGDDLFVIDVASGKRMEEITAPNCNSAAFSVDGHWLFASGPSNHVAVWDLKSQKKVAENSGHVSSINRVCFSPDGKWVGTASDDRLVKLWTCDSWDLSLTLGGHLNVVKSLAFTPDGQTVATAGTDGSLKFWNLPTGQEMFELKTAPVIPTHLEFSSDGRLLACLYSDPTSPTLRQTLHVLKWRTEEARSTQEIRSANSQ